VASPDTSPLVDEHSRRKVQPDFSTQEGHTSSRALAYSGPVQTTVTCHAYLDATIRLRSAQGQTLQQIAQTFNESGSSP